MTRSEEGELLRRLASNPQQQLTDSEFAWLVGQVAGMAAESSAPHKGYAAQQRRNPFPSKWPKVLTEALEWNKIIRARDLSANQSDLTAKAGRTPDSKTDKKEKSRAVVPRNPDVARLAKKIKREWKDGETKIGIALDFTEGDRTKATSLLRSLDRFPQLLG